MADPTKSKGMRWLLFGSVALNFALAAALIAGLVAGPRHGQGREHRATPLVAGAPYARAVAREDRRILRDALNANRPSRSERVAQYRKTVQLLRAEPFEASALEAHFSALSARMRATEVGTMTVLVEYLLRLSDAERLAYAQRLAEDLDKARVRDK